MAGEQAEQLPEPLRQWVAEKADAMGTTESDVIARALTAYRLVDEGNDELEAYLDADLEGVTGRIDELETRVEHTEDDFEEKLADVRDRVVQVKRETDGKAALDHDHSKLQERLTRALQRVAEVDATVTDMRNRVDDGFENYEEVLEYLRDETDELDTKQLRLARAVLDARDRLERLEETRSELLAVRRLQTTANRHGETTATCEHCGSRVALGLLSKPSCPSCESRFVDLEPSKGFFGSATLQTGTRPALEAGDDSTPGVRLTELFEDGPEGANE